MNPIPCWRNPEWRYSEAASHADSDAFRRRQQERVRQAQHKPSPDWDQQPQQPQQPQPTRTTP